jgi:nicotinate phosphoribosyltransferase
MSTLTDRYRPSLALATDLYQLTMASGYWSLGRHEDEAVFHLFFRKYPFGGGYAIAAGLAEAIDLLANWRLDPEDLAYLRSLTGADGQPLLAPGFVDWLEQTPLRLTVDAIPEGTVVHPHEPLLRVRGPLAWCQLVETPLLTLVNFATLIATKAARIACATQGEPVLEFGLRRAQGIDGGLSASRAAYLGGCAGTSNVLAGRLFGIPIKGTHAHSWVMSFDDELAAFDAYAGAMPNNCVLLVDTYDTIRGVQRAVEVGRRLRARGHELIGVRLDSGDLAELSTEARRILDAGGFPDAAVVASNDLDEHAVLRLKAAGARIGVWGIGTKLVTAYDQPALGGVYKLAGIRDEGGWDWKVKLSEDPIKVSNPGLLQVRRFADADVLYNAAEPPTDWRSVDLATGEERHHDGGEDLLVPALVDGVARPLPTLEQARARCAAQVAALPEAEARIDSPQRRPVSLAANLHALKARLIAEARETDR